MIRRVLLLLLLSIGCLGGPKAELANWPYGYKAVVAPTFEVEVEGVDEINTVTKALDSRSATFFVVAGHFQYNPRSLYLLRKYEVASMDWNQSTWKRFYTSKDFQKFEIETSQSWMKKIGYPPKGFRAPFFMGDKNTLKALEELEYEYDSSQYLGFLPYMRGGVVEIPVSLNFDIFWNDASVEYLTLPFYLTFQRAYDEDGLFTFSTHVFKASRHIENLTRFLEFAESKNVWIASCGSVASWWVQREKLELHIEKNMVIIKNRGSEDIDGVTVKFRPRTIVKGARGTWGDKDAVYAVLPTVPAMGEASLVFVNPPLIGFSWWT